MLQLGIGNSCKRWFKREAIRKRNLHINRNSHALLLEILCKLTMGVQVPNSHSPFSKVTLVKQCELVTTFDSILLSSCAHDFPGLPHRSLHILDWLSIKVSKR